VTLPVLPLRYPSPKIEHEKSNSTRDSFFWFEISNLKSAILFEHPIAPISDVLYEGNPTQLATFNL